MSASLIWYPVGALVAESAGWTGHVVIERGAVLASWSFPVTRYSSVVQPPAVRHSSISVSVDLIVLFTTFLPLPLGLRFFQPVEQALEQLGNRSEGGEQLHLMDFVAFTRP